MEVKYLESYTISCQDRKYILEIIERIDIDRDRKEDIIEYWLQAEGYGIKQFLIGIPKENHTEEFKIDYLENRIGIDIGNYREEFED